MDMRYIKRHKKTVRAWLDRPGRIAYNVGTKVASLGRVLPRKYLYRRAGSSYTAIFLFILEQFDYKG